MKFIVPDMPFNVKSLDNFKDRYNYINTYGFVYLSWNWLNPLIKCLKGKKCLEVMAGTGALSHVLQEKGINVIVTDNMEWHNLQEYKNTWGKRTWIDIENLDAITAVKKYGKEIDVLIMSWPYMDNTAYETIKELYNINPSATVLYIGESEWGCTADDNFFRVFEEITSEEFDYTASLHSQYFKAQWYGIHDYPVFGKYNPEKDIQEQTA